MWKLGQRLNFWNRPWKLQGKEEVELLGVFDLNFWSADHIFNHFNHYAFEDTQ